MWTRTKRLYCATRLRHTPTTIKRLRRLDLNQRLIDEPAPVTPGITSEIVWLPENKGGCGVRLAITLPHPK